MEYPAYWLVNSNFSEGWEGETFTFVWRLDGTPEPNTKEETRRNAQIMNMIRAWCRIEEISESWAETLTVSKIGSLDLVVGLSAIQTYLIRKGCHL